MKGGMAQGNEIFRLINESWMLVFGLLGPMSLKKGSP